MAKNTENRRVNLFINLNGRAVYNDLTTLTKESNKLYGQLKKLTPGTDEFVKKSAELKKVKGHIKDIRTEINGVQGKKGGGGLSAIKNMLPALGPAMIAVFAVQKVMEFARGLAQAVSEMNKLKTTATQLTGLTGDSLNTFVANSKAIAQTFDQDVNKVMQAANNYAQAFNVTQAEALESLEKGFLAGADVSGEFLDQMREYPSLLKETGIEGEEAIAIMTRQVKEGVYSDKGIDAIKEANIRLREMAPATKQALETIGLSSTEIQQGLESGQLKMIDVIRQVSQRLDTLPPQSQRVGQVLADVFGGAGEDAGLEFLTSLQDSNVVIDDMIDRTSDLTVAQQNNLEASKLWNKAIVDLTGPSSTLGRIWSEIKLSVAESASVAASDSVGFWEKVLGFMDRSGALSAKNKQKVIAAQEILEAQLAAEEQARREQEIEEENQKLLGQLRNEGNRLKIEGIEEMDLETLQMAVNQAQKEINAEKEKQEKLEKERVKAIEKQAKEKAKAEEDINKFLADAALDRELAAMGEDERELQRIRNQYDEKIKLAKKYGLSSKELESDRQAAIKAQEDLFMQRNLEQKLAFQDQLFMMGLSANQREIMEVNKKYEGLWSQVEKGSEGEALIIKLWDDEIAAITDQQNAEELAKKKAHQDKILQAELASIEARRAIASSLAQGLNNLLEAAASDSADFAEFQKGIALFQIGVDTASAISSTVKMAAAGSVSPIDMALKFAASFAMITANILKAKKLLTGDAPEAPSFGRGGVLPGSRHSMGGNPVYDRRTGRQIAEVEEGEPILSRETYKNNRPVVDALLDASMNRSGARVDWLFEKPLQFNYEAAVRSGRFMRDGGIISSKNTSVDSYSISKQSESSADSLPVGLLIDILMDLRDNGVQAVIGDLAVRQLKKRTEFLSEVENDARLG